MCFRKGLMHSSPWDHQAFLHDGVNIVPPNVPIKELSLRLSYLLKRLNGSLSSLKCSYGVSNNYENFLINNNNNKEVKESVQNFLCSFFHTQYKNLLCAQPTYSLYDRWQKLLSCMESKVCWNFSYFFHTCI